MDALVEASVLEQLVQRIFRLERLIQDVVKDEFARLGMSDVSVEQALLLYRMRGRRMTPTEIKQQGCYLGSNVTYNVKSMVEAGYLHRTRSNEDRRQVHLQATERGQNIATVVNELFGRLGSKHENTRIKAALGALNLLDQFLAGEIRHIY